MPAPASPVMSAPEVSAYLDEVFPQIKANGDDISVEAVSAGTALVRLHADDKHLRPGGTVSGPTLFMLADLAAYAVILLAQLAWVLVLHGRFRYRLLHAHWLVPQGVVVVLFKHLLFWQRLPVLLTSHGGDLFALQGGILNRLKGWVIRHADALTVVSEAMRQHVVAHWPAVDVQVLPMGVDFEQRFVVDDSRPRNSIIYVGRLVEKKGVHVLLDAFALLAGRRPDCPQLVVVGDGPDRAMLQSQCHALGLGERVLFMGALPQTRLAGVYARAILAVMPSVVARDGDQEGLGLVAVEAMGCGVPVLASDLPAVRDAVIDGQTGRLFPAGDPEALAVLMATLLDDPEAREVLAEQARQYAVSRFGWAGVAAAYAGLYEALG